MFLRSQRGCFQWGAAAAVLVTLIATQAEASFTWGSAASGFINVVDIQSMSIDPVAAEIQDLRVLPLRWDVYYNPNTGVTQDVQLSFGLPTGYSDPGGFRIVMPIGADAKMGSGTYAVSNAQVPSPGNYSFSNVGSPGGDTLTMSTKLLEAFTVGSVDLTLEKREDVWIEIPQFDIPPEGTLPAFFDSASYYMKFTFKDETDAPLAAYEMYFDVSEPTNFMVNYIPTAVPEPSSLIVWGPALAGMGLVWRRREARN